MIALEKYRNRNQKHICPMCEKLTFVKYFDDDNNCHINDNVGRCDREIECGYHYTPKEYYKDNSIDKNKYNQPRTFVPKQRSTSSTNSTSQQQPINYIPFDYIEKAAATRNNHFVEFLLDYFDWDSIKNAINPYFIGSTKDRRIVYPQIDADGNVRTAKIMEYDPITGKRKKNGVNAFDWMHSILIKKGLLPEDFEKKTCFFGEHLIRSAQNKGKTVCILESEKSALLAAIYMPQYLWMASGGMNSLNVDKLKPLKGRKIILYPDSDTKNVAFDKWGKIAKEARQVGFDISISTLLDRICTPEQKAIGYDLGDFIIDDIKTPKTEIPQHFEANPHESIPIDTGNDILNSMIKQNSIMMDFINKFDLIPTQTICTYEN